jgi:hypothetical protein
LAGQGVRQRSAHAAPQRYFRRPPPGAPSCSWSAPLLWFCAPIKRLSKVVRSCRGSPSPLPPSQHRRSRFRPRQRRQHHSQVPLSRPRRSRQRQQPKHQRSSRRRSNLAPNRKSPNPSKFIQKIGAVERTRTSTVLLPLAPQASASASSATTAHLESTTCRQLFCFSFFRISLCGQFEFLAGSARASPTLADLHSFDQAPRKSAVVSLNFDPCVTIKKIQTDPQPGSPSQNLGLRREDPDQFS